MRVSSFVACASLALSSANLIVNAGTYDVVVVGSGPGGLVAAEYLSRDPNVSVLILEAGPKSMAATGGTDAPDYAKGSGLTKFDIPGQYDLIMYNPDNEQYRVDWVSDAYMWLGKTVGGCSSISSVTYFRPPDIYTNQSQWPFSASQMNAKMDENEKMHEHTDVPSPDGKWYTQEGYALVSKALLSLGYSKRTLNDPDARNNKHKTFGHVPFTIKNGQRDSPAAAFWAPMSTRSNVKLLTKAKVDFLVRDAKGKATGVVYNGGSQALVSARGAVLMAAGALGTPKVLIQSGVGPNSQLDLLEKIGGYPGISQDAGRVANPNVGRNLFDANLMYVSFSHPDMKSFIFDNMPPDAISQYMNKSHTGPWAGAGPTLISYESYEVQGRKYDFQSNVLTHGFGELGQKKNAFTVAMYVTNPESRAHSGFDVNGDWRAFNEGDAYFGTPRDLAAMQSDIERCADEKLCVVGLENVFVADASAMKESTVSPYGFVMYIGREAADQAKRYIASNKGSTDDTCLPLENDVDFQGGDIGVLKSASSCPALEDNVAEPHGVTMIAKSSEKCCSVCKATGGCKAFTWKDQNGGTCWVKGGKENK
ncbi:Cellobiose dehydrogenase [Phytophthora cinnamomi]|uniref:Cellobiose dehydrogenase n=1 Tax=Phytophthora cinnamomi TaxID=4785 RepID=UPI003559D99B|nr:Cellobiose dehydrogenase [Phytophthora cinnamomi]